jgi:hypothetical protein
MRYYSILAALLLFAFTTQAKEAYIENKGQVVDQNRVPNSSVLYLYNGNGLNVQLRRTGFSYDVWKTDRTNAVDAEALIDPKKAGIVNYTYNRVDLNFINASPAMTVINADKSADYLNYYTEFTGANGITHIHNYGQVTYQNVWQGIDVQFVTNNGHAKYNFIVHPGAQLSDIKLDIKGANNISINNNDLELSTNLSVVKESVPYAYYSLNDKKTTVQAGFVKNMDGSYGFSAAGTIPANAILVIDPVPDIVWGTYYGLDNEDSRGLAVDKAGNSYFCGWNAETTNVATSGAFQATMAGTCDAHIVRFNTNGTRSWGTYYGGSWIDYANRIVTDATGQYVYVCGLASGGGSVFGTAGTFQPVSVNGDAAFLSKFDSTGVRVWGTYFDGQMDEEGRGVAIDDTGNIYMVGNAQATTLGTAGTFQASLGGNSDGFIAKFSSAGARKWCSYFGGIYYDELRAVAVKNGYLFAGGKSQSPGLASPGAYQTTNTPVGGDHDIILTKFDLNGNRLWSTYYGAVGQDEVFGATADDSGCVYIGGRAASDSFTMASPGCFSKKGQAYIAKFDGNGNRSWSTKFASVYVYGMSFNKNTLYFTGSYGDTINVGTPGALYPTPYKNSPTGAIMQAFTRGGQRVWGTYYGANAIVTDVQFDASNYMYVTGTSSDSFRIGTPGSFMPNYGSGGGGSKMSVLAKFTTCPAGFASGSVNFGGSEGSTATFSSSGGNKYQWTGPNGFSSNQPGFTKTNVQAADTGTYTVVVTDTVTGCSETMQFSIGFTENVRDLQGNTFSLYPNPNSGLAQIDLDLKQQQQLSVFITDITGKTVYTIDAKTYRAGKSKIELDARSLAAGTYICRLANEYGNTVWSGKVVKE